MNGEHSTRIAGLVTSGWIRIMAAGAGVLLAAGAPPAAAGQAAVVAPGTISTFAGGPGGPAPATAVSLALPGNGNVNTDASACGLVAADGGFYVADGTTVRQVARRNDGLTTLLGAGSGYPQGGPLSGGPAAITTSYGACGVARDHSGNLVIADSILDVVRVRATHSGTFYGQAMTAGDIYTVAGDGEPGLGGSGVPATQTMLSGPWGVTVDAHGNLVIADFGKRGRNKSFGAEIRVVAAVTGRFYGISMTAGDIYTVAGHRVGGAGYTGDGGPATRAGLGELVGSVAIDKAGNLVLADRSDNAIRVTAVRTGTFYGHAMTAGHIYTVAGDGTAGFSGDGGPATAAELNSPTGIAVDTSGNLVIGDSANGLNGQGGNNRVRVVAAVTGAFYGQPMTAGHIYTVAGNGTAGFSGDGGPAASAELSGPDAVAVDDGNLVIGDSGNDRVRVVAASTGTFYGQAMAAGDIYTVAGNGTTWFSGDGGPAGHAQIYTPQSVTTDAAGNTLIAETGSNRIRVVAASSGTFYGQAMTAKDIYTVAGGGTGGLGDGGPATSAELNGPSGVAADAAGNLVIADELDFRIRVVAARNGTFYGKPMTAGHIYTVAGDGTPGTSGDGGPATSAELDLPAGVAVDTAGNLVIADSGSSRIRVVAASSGTFYGKAMTAGDIYAVAGAGGAGFGGDGGPATKALLSFPVLAALDAAGNLLICDEGNNRIRVVAESSGTFYGQAMITGDIYTVAGGGTGGLGDGGPATHARFASPSGVTVDAAGNLVVADTFDNRIRVVAESAGTFYGKTMTAGDIYTVAGNGGLGFSGDGLRGTRAQLEVPHGVAATAAGGLLIADSTNNRIRMLTG